MKYENGSTGNQVLWAATAVIIITVFLSACIGSQAFSEERPRPPVGPDQIQADMDGVAAAFKAYEAKHGTPPPGMIEAFGGAEPVDPWGTPYRMEMFSEMEAGGTGLDYQVHSAGPDREFGTPDDLAWPEPDPNFEPSPIWKERHGQPEEEE